MTINNNYPFVPENYSLTENYIRKIVQSVNSAMRGNTNNTGEFTLTASATSTTVTDNRVNPQSVITIMPKTNNAATHVQHYYIVPGDKQFVMYHNNNSSTDRTFRYVVTG